MKATMKLILLFYIYIPAIVNSLMDYAIGGEILNHKIAIAEAVWLCVMFYIFHRDLMFPWLQVFHLLQR